MKKFVVASLLSLGSIFALIYISFGFAAQTSLGPDSVLKSSPLFEHSLKMAIQELDNPGNVIPKIQEYQNQIDKTQRQYQRPSKIIIAQPTLDFTVCQTCVTCLDTVCQGHTCGGATCYVTCDNCPTTWSTCSGTTCGTTCGATCGATCGTTCSGATCGTTCSGATCGTTCSGATCGTTCSGPTCTGSFYYFPHITSNSTWETEICVINTSAVQSLTGDLKAYNDSGQEVSSTPVVLALNGRREIIIGDELPNPSDIGYIIFESDSENVCGYTKFYIEGKYRVAIPATSDVNTGDIYISHIASNSDWWTGISILNTTSSSKELTVEFDNGTTKSITIAAKQHKPFTISSLFGGELQPNINSAVIKNGSGIVGLELFGSSDSSGDNYLSGILLKDDTTTHIYYPHIASNSTWWTGIVAYNPSITSCNLNITPFRDDGISLSPRTIPLAGKEKYMGTVQSLNFPEGTAWFRIIATGPITGFELFGTNDGNQLGGYTGVGISGTNGVFAKTEKDGWTGIAFVNIENAPATVTMTAYDDTGNVIDTETLNINAYAKVVDVAPNLFSQDISNATYIRYSSGGEVVGFQLNGSSDDMMLDALPGIVGGEGACGEGLPLTISNLSFPGTVTQGSTEDGSVAYQGSYTDIANPVMALRFPTDTGSTTTYRFNSIYTTSGCRINFKGSIPDDISGTGTTLFKVVDYTDGSKNWDENAVSNELSQTVVIQAGP